MATACRVHAGLLQGSRSSVVRALTAKVGGLGFNSQWLPMHFSFGMFPPDAYHQLLPPVVVDHKNNPGPGPTSVIRSSHACAQ